MFSLKGLKVIHYVDSYDKYDEKIKRDKTYYVEKRQYILTLEAQDDETRKMIQASSLQISMWTHDHECYSGYCMSKTAEVDITRHLTIPGFTHLPHPQYKDVVFRVDLDVPYCMDISLHENEPQMDEHTTKIGDVILFSFSRDGGDDYYPQGHVYINMDMFTTTPRAMEKRPTYIYYGESGIGKSYLASLASLANQNESRYDANVKSNQPKKVVFETDRYRHLPNFIYADIIVLGNKNKFSKEFVAKRIPKSSTPIFVHFFQPPH